jgi:hypothetical protein
MQLRDYDVRVNDEPEHVVPIPTDDHHAMVTPAVGGKESLRIPLALNGVTRYFTRRKPTRQEYEQCDPDLILELTAESVGWDLHIPRFQEQEATMLDERGCLLDYDRKASKWIAAIHTVEGGTQPEEQLYQALGNTTRTRTVTAKEKWNVVGALFTSKRGRKVGLKTLAKNWGIGVHQAQRMIDATTQYGLHTVLHPTLSRRFRTNDRQL